MRLVLLFYKKLRKELTENRFTLNPYNSCVANLINKSGDQMTTLRHVMTFSYHARMGSKSPSCCGTLRRSMETAS